MTGAVFFCPTAGQDWSVSGMGGSYATLAILPHQPTHLMGEVLHRAPLGHRHMTPAPLKGVLRWWQLYDVARFHRRKAVAPLKVSRCRSPVPGGRTGGLSLATGTFQAPQLVAPEANIRRDDHRGLHDARRRFNLAKSHGAR